MPGNAEIVAKQIDFVGWQGIVVLAAWTGALTAAACFLYRRDRLRPSAAGAT